MDAKVKLVGEKPKVDYQHRRLKEWAKKNSLQIKLVKNSLILEGEITTIKTLHHQLISWGKINEVEISLILPEDTKVAEPEK